MKTQEATLIHPSVMLYRERSAQRQDEFDQISRLKRSARHNLFALSAMQKVVRGALISQLNGYISKCKHVAVANEPGRLDFSFFLHDEAPDRHHLS